MRAHRSLAHPQKVSTLDHLVICDRCRHGATLHAGDGCGALRCTCAVNRETIIESALVLAKRDIHDAYRASSPEG